MATRKNTKKATPSDGVLITENEVWDVIKFANELYRGVYTPMLVNQAAQSITLNPQQATSEKIDAALLDPKNSQQALVGYSEFMSLSSMIYKRILLYFSGLLEFNLSYTCLNATDEDYKKYSEDGDKSKYGKDLKEIEMFFDKFDHKKEFKTAIKQMMVQEAFFGIFRDDGVYKDTIQELPQNRCLITGRWEMGLIFDFDMMLFYQPGNSLQMFPPIFTKMFNKAFGNKKDGTAEYNPALPIDRRTGNWVYYVQTSPKDGFWCFKLFEEQTTVIPFLSPFMKDVILQDLIRNLQKNSYIADASKIISGQVAFLKDTKASVKDSLSLSPETLAKFLQLVKSSLPSAISVLSAPLEQIQGIEFSGNKDLYDSYLKSTSSSAGINSRLIYSYDRQNILESKLSMDIDLNILRPTISQFERFLEYFVNQRTKKFKFKFHLTGFNTSIDREERKKTVKDYAESGIVIDQMWANANDMSPFDLRRQMAESKANGFVQKLTPVLKASQTPADGGRPAKADGDLSDGGADTRADGENME